MASKGFPDSSPTVQVFSISLDCTVISRRKGPKRSTFCTCINYNWPEPANQKMNTLINEGVLKAFSRGKLLEQPLLSMKMDTGMEKPTESRKSITFQVPIQNQNACQSVHRGFSISSLVLPEGQGQRGGLTCEAMTGCRLPEQVERTLAIADVAPLTHRGVNSTESVVTLVCSKVATSVHILTSVSKTTFLCVGGDPREGPLNSRKSNPFTPHLSLTSHST